MNGALRNYWGASVSQQQEVRQSAQRLELEAYAREYQLVIHGGKLIKPEDYPCQCELQDPAKCRMYRVRGSTDKTCMCVCHTYFEPY